MTSKYNKISLIESDTSLKQLVKKDKIKQLILEQIQILITKKYVLSPNDIRLIRLIGTYIENLVKKHHQLDKLAMFIELLKELFQNISPDELTTAISLLEDLLKSKQIKKIPVLRFALHLGYELVKDTANNFFFAKS